MREEVAVVDQRRHPRAVQCDPHDVAVGHGRPVVRLADREQLPALPGESAEPHAVIGGRQDARLLAGLERPDALVGLLDEQQDAVIRGRPRAAAVLVHARSRVPGSGEHVDDIAVRRASPDGGPTRLLGHALAPPHVRADEAGAFDSRASRPSRPPQTEATARSRKHASHSWINRIPHARIVGSGCRSLTLTTGICICSYGPRHSAQHTRKPCGDSANFDPCRLE